MSSPAFLTDLRKRLTAQQPVDPTIPTGPVMTGAMPQLTAPAAPEAVLTPNARDLTRNAVTQDRTELTRLRTDGSGIDQIQNGGLRRLARVGETALSILNPGIAALTPGTTLHNQRLQGIQERNLQGDLQADQSQAQTELTNAQPQLKQMGLDNARLKLDNQQDHWDATQQIAAERAKNQHTDSLRKMGLAIDESDPAGQKTRPMRYEELGSKEQAIEDLKHAQTSYAEAQAELKKAQNDPTSPAYRLAKEKADSAVRNADTAHQRLGLQAESLGMRRENMDAMLYGKGRDGQPITGAAQLLGDDGQLQTVGQRFAANAEKQQKAVGTFNDLSGSVQHTRDALTALQKEGGSLADARVVQAMSDPHSTIGKVINGKLVTAGLSPTAITAINSVRQLHEQAAILRSVTGGTASEANAQRILDTVPVAGTANNDAFSRLDQLETTLKRVSPAITSVKGGLSVKNRPSVGGGAKTYSQTATGPGGHKIGSNDGGQTWYDTQTGKAVQ